jgi:phage-related minor tail protein
VITSGALMANASRTQIEGITAGAMNLAQAFNLDVSESMRAVSQLVKTGLAPDATAAMDLITVSFQKFGPQAQDVLDTVTEYSTQFRKLGIDGPQAMGLIQQGLQAGARDTDTIADALKEFSIRAIDGSKTTAEGFKAIGLNADEMAKKFAQGGPVAQQALDLVIDRLRGMKNPVDQSRAAVDLFGTKAEDLGAALFALDPSSAVNALGQVAGANSKLGDTMGDTAQNKITAMQRSWESWSMSLVSAKGPLGDVAAGVMAFGQSGLSMAGNFAMVTVALSPFGGQILGLVGTVASATGSMIVSVVTWSGTMVVQGAIAAGSMAANVARMVAGWVLMGAQALLQAGRVAVAWVIAMGPIGWAIAAAVALVAAIVMNWDRIKAWTGAMVDFVVGKFWEFINWISGIGGRILGAIGNLGSLLWNSGVALISGFWDGLVARWNQLMAWARSAMQSLRNLWPFSPAKEGPFSGRGYVTYSGRALTDDFAASLRQGMPNVLSAAQGVLNAAQGTLASPAIATATQAAVSGAAAAGGGGIGRLVIDSAGSRFDDALVEVLKMAIRERGGDPGILGT